MYGINKGVFLNSLVIVTISVLKPTFADDLLIRKDGSYDFGYSGPDSFHESQANRNNVVRGKFGGRNPKTGGIDQITYTAGPRGFRPRGDNVARKYDLSQVPRGPIGSRDDPYFDPNEDPSYNFRFRTRTYQREEGADSRGDVKGRYSYVDDVGERHNVEYVAGSNTGFLVKTPFPDSNLQLYGRLFINGRGKPLPRGRTSIQQRGDGSYKFISAGPDQRRVESSDASGYVTGSYTYLDDKGVQHTVNYEAGPEIGYRVIKQTPNFYPFRYPDIIPPEPPFFDKADDDLFDTAASGPIKPLDNNNIPGGGRQPSVTTSRPGSTFDSDDFGVSGGSTTSRPTYGGGSTTTGRPSRPSYDDFGDDEDIGDLFGDTGSRGTSTTRRPSAGGSTIRPSTTRRPVYGPGDTPSSTLRPGSSTSGIPGHGKGDDYDDGSYKPDDGSYGRPKPKPAYDDGSYKPSGADDGYKPSSGGGGYKPSGGGGSYTPAGDGGSYRPSGGTGGRYPSGGANRGTYRPSGGGGGGGGGLGGGGGGGGYPPARPRPRPSYDYDEDTNDVNDDFGLFGKPTSSRPFTTRRPGQIGISTGTDGGRGGSTRPGNRHTIVTNIGDELFSVPPGVSVRAHVQSIDLLPVNSKVLSPSEQYHADTENRSKLQDSDNAESNNILSNSEDNNVTYSTTEEPQSTTLETTTTATTTSAS